MDEQVSKPAGEIAYNRACDACRQHKVRCLPAKSHGEKICQRCAKTDRQCVFTAPQKRKPRKRTDTRVAELEREVQAMRSFFQRRKGPDTSTPHPFHEGTGAHENDTSTTPSGADVHLQKGIDPSSRWVPDTTNSSPSWTVQSASPQQNAGPSSDVIDRGVISEELATVLFNTYVTDLAPQSPLIVFRPDTTADFVRRTKPTLFLATIAAASGRSDPSLFSILNSEVLSTYAHRTVVQSEKSMELVQAMIVSVNWYQPPGEFAQLKFYEYIHAAATMAMDIGLGTNPNIRRLRRGTNNTPPADQSPESALEDLEKKRTWLACYLMTTNVAMSMRRPGMLRFNNWISECLDVLSQSPLVLPSDKHICQWVRLVVLSEDIFTSFAYDDENNVASLSDSRVQFMLKNFERRLELWKSELTPESHRLLWLAYHHTVIYMHEIAIHDEHPPEDFRPPFRLEQPLQIENDSKLTSIHIESIASMIASSHSMLDLLLALDIDTLRSIPIYNYIRISYACIIITKLYTSCRSGDSQIATILDPKNLRIDFYMTALIARLTEAVGPMECRTPYPFLGLIMRIHDWYLKQEASEEFVSTMEMGINDQSVFNVPPPPAADGRAIFMTDHSASIGADSTVSLKQEPPSAFRFMPGATGQFPGQDGRVGPPAAFDSVALWQFDPSLFQAPTEALSRQADPQSQPQVNYLDPFQLFQGLDGLSGDYNDWAANVDRSAEFVPTPGDMRNWTFEG